MKPREKTNIFERKLHLTFAFQHIKWLRIAMVKNAGETSYFDKLLWDAEVPIQDGLTTSLWRTGADASVGLGPQGPTDLNSYIVLIVELCQPQFLIFWIFLELASDFIWHSLKLPSRMMKGSIAIEAPR